MAITITSEAIARQFACPKARIPVSSIGAAVELALLAGARAVCIKLKLALLVVRRPQAGETSSSLIPAPVARGPGAALLAQLIARCRSAGLLVSAALPEARPPGVIAACSPLCLASTLWYRVRWTRGFGTSAASCQGAHERSLVSPVPG